MKVDGFKLTLNGQERHPSLTNLSRKYLMERLMPLLHSNTSTMHRDAANARRARDGMTRGSWTPCCDCGVLHSVPRGRAGGNGARLDLSQDLRE